MKYLCCNRFFVTDFPWTGTIWLLIILMKTITFFESYLWKTMFLRQKSVLAATIFAWIEEMKKTLMGGRLSNEDKPLKKKFFLTRTCKGTASVFSNMATTIIFMNHEKKLLNFWQSLRMYLFHEPTLGRFISNVLLRLWIVNWLPRTGFVEISDSWVWQKNVNDGVYFNDFIKLNLVQDILKRVIMNEMTSSSWGFKRFDRICLTVNRNKFREVSQ